MNIAQEVARGLKEAARGGSIVNLSAVSGIIANNQFEGSCAYAASKGGMDAMTRVMAMELGPSQDQSELHQSYCGMDRQHKG